MKKQHPLHYAHGISICVGGKDKLSDPTNGILHSGVKMYLPKKVYIFLIIISNTFLLIIEFIVF